DPFTMRTPPPNRAAELLRIAQAVKTAFDEISAPPPPSTARFDSNTQLVSAGDDSWITNPPPAALGGVPFRNVSPLKLTEPVARNTFRAAAFRPLASTIVVAAPEPTTLKLLLVPLTERISKYVPAWTLIVAPFGSAPATTALIAAWMVG